MTPKHARPPDLTEELGLLMGKARRRFWALASRGLEASGESFTLWRVLSQLHRIGKSTQTDLANAVGLDPPTISRLVETLEREELVHRERDPSDRRRIYVQLTRQGYTRLERMRPSIRDAVNRHFQPLDEAERRTLRDLLSKLVADDPKDGG